VVIDLDPVDRITADAVGDPGERVFYLQARKGEHLVTLLLEKQQVQLLAASVVEILARLGKETGAGLGDEAMRLEGPIDPEWRAGRLSIGYDEDRDLILLEAEELLDEEEGAEGDDEEELGALAIELEAAELPGTEEELDGENDDTDWDEDLEELEDLEGLPGLEGEVPAEDPSKARFWATREQMLSLARYSASVCAQGRPRCQLCGNPIDPEGHRCPALNGHREATE
jgi:uncharacterized repeat protein (TIGR03847 family)